MSGHKKKELCPTTAPPFVRRFVRYFVYRGGLSVPPDLLYPCVGRISNVDWTALLADGGVPDSPGRTEAVEIATAKSAAKAAIKSRPKASKGKGRTKFPGLKHSAQ